MINLEWSGGNHPHSILNLKLLIAILPIRTLFINPSLY